MAYDITCYNAERMIHPEYLHEPALSINILEKQDHHSPAILRSDTNKNSIDEVIQSIF